MPIGSAAPAAAATPTVVRIAGNNRFGTAAALSRSTFSPGVPVVFIATGDDFPDALAAGPVAAHDGGPVLLTHFASLPDETAAELTRLTPGRIVIVGGTAAVSTTVANQLATFTSGNVTRVAGADRYATAVAMSESTFPSNTNTAFIATGAAFPDALSGGAAAANDHGGGPMLLTEPDAVPPGTSAEIARLNLANLRVMGGTGAIGAGTFDTLDQSVVNGASRITGADRFATSANASLGAFPDGASTVVLATGRDFPDALAATAVAGFQHVPVLLVDHNCIPRLTAVEMVRLNPSKIVIAGGTSALTDHIDTLDTCEPVSFQDGEYVVGDDIPPGTYRTRTATSDCKWERVSGLDGTDDEVIASNESDGPQVVTISPDDAGFASDGCGTWTDNLSPITQSPLGPFNDGIWEIGRDVAPGAWTAPGGPNCYADVERGFGGTDDEVIRSVQGITNPTIVLHPYDAAVFSDGCGIWMRAAMQPSF